MGPGKTAKDLAKHIDIKMKMAEENNVEFTIDDVATIIELVISETSINGLYEKIGHLRNKIKEQKLSFIRLNRAHVVLIHESRDWVREKLRRRAQSFESILDDKPVENRTDITSVKEVVSKLKPKPLDHEQTKLRDMGFPISKGG